MVTFEPWTPSFHELQTSSFYCTGEIAQEGDVVFYVPWARPGCGGDALFGAMVEACATGNAPTALEIFHPDRRWRVKEVSGGRVELSSAQGDDSQQTDERTFVASSSSFVKEHDFSPGDDVLVVQDTPTEKTGLTMGTVVELDGDEVIVELTTGKKRMHRKELAPERVAYADPKILGAMAILAEILGRRDNGSVEDQKRRPDSGWKEK